MSSVSECKLYNEQITLSQSEASFSPVDDDVRVSPDGGGEVCVLVQRQAVVAPLLLRHRPRGEVHCLLHGRGSDVPQQEVHSPVTTVHTPRIIFKFLDC